MCRLLAHVTPHPTTTSQLLGAGQTRRFERMSLLHDDGWGTAWLDRAGTTIKCQRDPSPAHSQGLLRHALESEPALARLVHLRLATDAMAVAEVNTHPFCDGSVAFAHNGSIVPTDHLTALLSDEDRTSLLGDTDSERYFALLRRHFGELGALDDAMLATVRILRSAYPHASLNCIALTTDSLCVAHVSSDAPVPWEDFVASGLSGDDMPLDHSEAYFTMSYRAVDGGGWAFTSAGLETRSWNPLPPDSVTTVDLHTMELQTRQLAPVSR